MTNDRIYRAVLFDLDGTLLNTLEDIANSANRVLEGFGFPQHPLEAYKYFVGEGRDVLVHRIIPNNQHDPTIVAKVSEKFELEYSQHWHDTTRPYEGIPELLGSLTDRGIKMAVLSNKPNDSARLAVSRMLPHWQFNIVLGVSPSIPRKPDPAGANDIARFLKIAPDNFLYLGDTDIDMKTAIAAGMYPIGALWGFRAASELLAGGAKALLVKPLELLKFFSLKESNYG